MAVSDVSDGGEYRMDSVMSMSVAATIPCVERSANRCSFNIACSLDCEKHVSTHHSSKHMLPTS